jgi:hypothetical protein
VTFKGKGGIVAIRATAKDGSGKYDERAINVTVKQTPSGETPGGQTPPDPGKQQTTPGAEKATGIIITGALQSSYLYDTARKPADNTAQLTATVAPADASKAVQWSSSDESIATVSQTGLVTFKAKEGVVKIKAAAQDGSGVSAEKAITVALKTTALRTPITSFYLAGKGKSVTLPVKAYNGNTPVNTKLTATVTGTGKSSLKATVSNSGVIKITVTKKAKKDLKAKIAVSTASGKKATFNVTIGKKASALKSFKLKLPKKATLTAGKTYQIKITTTPKKAGNLGKVSFKSSKTSVLKVDSTTGFLTAQKQGKAKITVTIGKKKVVKTITVKKAAGGAAAFAW